MNKIFKIGGLWIGLSLLWTVLWIVGLMIAVSIIQTDLPNAASDSGNTELMLLVICMLNTAVVLLYLSATHLRAWKLVGVLFVILFGLQYLMSQIETLWFNDSLKMSESLIAAVVTGGALSSAAFSVSAVWISGKFERARDFSIHVTFEKKLLITRILFHAVFTWPVLYLLAGYFIAWQFSEVRQYYTGSETMDTFFDINKQNVMSGLYFFQIFRGFLWILIGLTVLYSVKGDAYKKALILGLLFSFISSSQLLLPNPIMPDGVRIAHLIETGTSNFIWGYILALTLSKYITIEKFHLKESIS